MTSAARSPGVGELKELATLGSLVAVCAHPDDESFGLGAVISTLAAHGTGTSVLSFTHGEASTLHAQPGDLGPVRAAELAAAGRVLGAGRVQLLDHPDGSLSAVGLDELAGEVAAFTRTAAAGGLLVFDHGGITGHPDHQRATDAAVAAGGRLDLPVLAWALPESVATSLNAEFGTAFAGRRPDEVDLVVEVDRAVQRRAIACHTSQATHNPVLWRRLELLGDVEWLRWLRPPR